MGDETDRPSLAVVAENSDRDIKRSLAREKASHALIELTANLLRVVRGAGRPYTVGQDCAAVIDAFEEYRAVTGLWPNSFEISQAIGFDDLPSLETTSSEWYNVQSARNFIVQGALQIVASHLLDQRTQKRAGETELTRGIRAYEEAQSDYRRKIEGDMKARRGIERGARGTKAAKKSAPRRSRKNEPEL